MILFDLKCARDHVFEAWFPNNAAYEKQAKAGAIACPACASRKVEKAPMAPRIGKAPGEKMTAVASEHAEIRKKLVELRSRIEASCDYVGDKFAEEARRIHYGETERRDIYGEASDDEAKELNEEGVEFARVPWLPRHNS
ncbi:MAG TPA: DUF1178 family protein [Dongiaceae bacterium]|jgi:hypothetical protein